MERLFEVMRYWIASVCGFGLCHWIVCYYTGWVLMSQDPRVMIVARSLGFVIQGLLVIGLVRYGWRNSRRSSHPLIVTGGVALLLGCQGLPWLAFWAGLNLRLTHSAALLRPLSVELFKGLDSLDLDFREPASLARWTVKNGWTAKHEPRAHNWQIVDYKFFLHFGASYKMDHSHCLLLKRCRKGEANFPDMTKLPEWQLWGLGDDWIILLPKGLAFGPFL
jgi:hypothetical protein